MEVTFTDEPTYGTRPAASRSSGLLSLVQRWGFAKDDKGASIVLMVVAGMCIVIAVLLLVGLGSSKGTLSPEEYQERAQQDQAQFIPR